MSLKGKVAVVTGASRGIGRAIALRLARDGALVCVNYHSNAEAAQAVVGEIEAAGGEAFALQADVGSVEQLGRFFEALDAELTARRGDRRFDILVNNAGVAVVGPTADGHRGRLRPGVRHQRQGAVLHHPARHPPAAGRRAGHQRLLGAVPPPDAAVLGLQHDQGGDRHVHRGPGGGTRQAGGSP